MPVGPEKSIRFSGTGIRDGCELPYTCWELNPGLLLELQVFFTSEVTLQCHNHLSEKAFQAGYFT